MSPKPGYMAISRAVDCAKASHLPVIKDHPQGESNPCLQIRKYRRRRKLRTTRQTLWRPAWRLQLRMTPILEQ
jgi:hypothetical protein